MTMRWYAVVTAIVSCMLLRPADAELRGRSFNRFELDSESARGLWGEVATFSSNLEDGDDELNEISVVPRVAYGWKWAEIGLSIPYRRLTVDESFIGSETNDGLGDMSFYGKGVFRSEWVDAGLGLLISVPTGDEDDGLGAGEAGFLPFGTAAVHLGPLDVRGHVGYLAYTDHTRYFPGFEYPIDQLTYGGGIFAGFGEYIAGRAEFIGVQPDIGSNPDLVTFEPGIDVRIPLGAVDLLIRPTGSVGITDDAPDWGVGGGIAVNWNPEAP